MVARWAHNPKVTGSSPVPATKKASENQGLFAFVCFGFIFFFQPGFKRPMLVSHPIWN